MAALVVCGRYNPSEADPAIRPVESVSYDGWRESLAAVPAINRLKEKAESHRQAELKKCTRKLSQNENFSDKELEAVERLSRGIVNKLLHGPMSHLRKSDSVDGRQAAVRELSDMFQLGEEENKRSGRGNRRRR